MWRADEGGRLNTETLVLLISAVSSGELAGTCRKRRPVGGLHEHSARSLAHSVGDDGTAEMLLLLLLLLGGWEPAQWRLVALMPEARRTIVAQFSLYVARIQSFPWMNVLFVVSSLNCIVYAATALVGLASTSR